MSKLQEKIEQYAGEMEKLGLSFDKDLLAAVTKGLGPSIYKKDAEVVSCSDSSEKETVKKNFLIKKLGLENNESLDAAVEAVCEKMGSSNKNKYRAIFYYLLTVDMGKEAIYDVVPASKKEVVAEKEAVKPAKEEKAKAPKKETKTETTKEAVVEAPKEEEVKVDPSQFLADFDWDGYEQGVGTADNEQRAAFEKLLEEDPIPALNRGDIITGKVNRITEREVIIDIKSKSEGVISLNEFRYNPDLKVGDDVDVMVDSPEDKNGQLVLSHRKARAVMAWDRVIKAHEDEEIVKGYVKSRTKGGMIVDVFGIDSFLPGSQIDVKPIRDYDQYVDKTMEFKVVKINHEFKNVVVSHKALIEADLEEQRKEMMGQLEKGQVLEGVVKNITSYGVFVDLGGIDGLVHITDLSWNRINHPSEVVELDQPINVVILDFDEDKTRIQLGIKQLSKHPWEALDESIKEGDTIKGKVSVLVDYGAFVEVVPGVEGLIHVSEMSWSTHLRSAQDFVKVGDEVDVVVLSIDREERKMSLGMKQLKDDPWKDIDKKYPIGTKISGKVRNYTNFGVFVELEEGIDGLVYISDLSWTKKIKHPSEFVKVGDQLDVVVLELDKEGRKLSLGHKQTTENPWDEYENSYPEGSVHQGEVVEIVDKGAMVQFADGVQGFAPGRHLLKEDDTKLKKGDTADFKVLEFNKDIRRIVVSHTSTFKEQEEKNVKAAAKKVAQNVEKATLGDIGGALADLKKKMDNK